MKNDIQIGICLWCIPEKGINKIKCASDMGYKGIVLEQGSIDSGFLLSTKDNQRELIEEAYKYNIEFPTLAVNEFCKTGMNIAKNYEIVKEIFRVTFDIAISMDIKTLQLPSFVKGFIRSEEELLNTAKCLKYICEMTKDTGIIVGTENGLSAEDNLRLLEMVNENHLKVYFDTANPYWISGRQYAPEILEKVKEHVCEVHLKDVGIIDDSDKLQFVPLGKGVVDIEESIKILKKMNYCGWVHNENSYSYDLLKQDVTYIEQSFQLKK